VTPKSIPVTGRPFALMAGGLVTRPTVHSEVVGFPNAASSFNNWCGKIIFFLDSPESLGNNVAHYLELLEA
jgi:hypothetical protein